MPPSLICHWLHQSQSEDTGRLVWMTSPEGPRHSDFAQAVTESACSSCKAAVNLSIYDTSTNNIQVLISCTWVSASHSVARLFVVFLWSMNRSRSNYHLKYFYPLCTSKISARITDNFWRCLFSPIFRTECSWTHFFRMITSCLVTFLVLFSKFSR